MKAGFKYDRETGKYLEDLVKMAKFEGYYEDATPEFEALRKKLKHDLSRELDRHSKDIRSALEMDILPAYYFQRGALAHQLRGDKQALAAKKLILEGKADPLSDAK